MNSVKCNKEDLMPVVLIALRLMDKDFGTWLMKFSLQDKSITIASDEQIEELLAIRAKLHYWILWYTGTANMTLELIYDDNRIMDLARTFYFHLVFDYQIDNDEYLNFDLLLFLSSAELILYCLCLLVMEGQVNLNVVFSHAVNRRDFSQHQYSENPLIRMLCNMYLDACNFRKKAIYLWI